MVAINLPRYYQHVLSVKTVTLPIIRACGYVSELSTEDSSKQLKKQTLHSNKCLLKMTMQSDFTLN